MAFGLVGILGALVAIVWIMSYTLERDTEVIRAGKDAREQTEHWAGYEPGTGQRADHSVTLEPETRGGKMISVVVTDVVAGGAMEKHFGLRRGDSIVEIGPLTVASMGSADAVSDMLLDAYQRSREIMVVRDGVAMKLPVATGDTPQRDPLQRQLDMIQRIPTH